MRPDREDRASPRDSCKKKPRLRKLRSRGFFACGEERVILSVSEGLRPSAEARPSTDRILRRFACPLVEMVAAHRPMRASFHLVTPPDAPRSGRYLLRLSMYARHFGPSAHASLRRYLPCGASRRSVPPPQIRSLPLPLAAVAYILPTRRYSRGASPVQASFRSFSPPQTRSLFPPPAAVTYLPPPGHARIPCVERHSVRAAILKTPVLYPR